MSYQEAKIKIEEELKLQTGMLNLSWLELDKIPIEIQKLTHLTTLDLSCNNIHDISILQSLNQLTTLDLSKNRIVDITPLEGLKKLTSLSLNTNRISDVQVFKSLGELSSLSLKSNKISDITPFTHLTNLTSLSLSENKISDIRPLLPLLKKSLSIGMSSAFNDINLGNNKLHYPPSEIVEQGNEAVLNYFNQLHTQEQDYLFEAKLLILGEGGAGKTTFARKLQINEAVMPLDKDTTKGIDVNLWQFDLTESDLKAAGEADLLKNENKREQLLKKKFFVNLWDFGGQEIYHSTHRFFLSGRSLYVLVADGRKQETDFNYWFNIVEQLGGKSPLLVVVNEKHGQAWRIDEQGLKGRFTFFKDTRHLDLGVDSNYSKLEELRETVRSYITRLPHIGDPLPASWTSIRAAIAKEKLPFISLDKYLEICQEYNMKDIKQALLLSQYFHDIGVFLHYQKDEVLKNRIFLNPNWITRTVYKLLNDKTVQNNLGRFNKEDVERIWEEEEMLLIHSELLKLLGRFKLAYCIDNTEEYIAPEYLQEQRPYEEWEFKEDLLMLSYEFDAFMPKGLMNDLIVEFNRFIPNHENVWRRGVVLKRQDAWAEITQAYGNEFRFDIKVSGKDKKEFLIIIAEEFDNILERLPKLIYEKLVPCNCQRCIMSNDKFFYKLSDLKRRLRNKRKDIDCPKNNDKPVAILPMLEETIVMNNTGVEKIDSLIAKNKLEKAFDLLAFQNSHETAQLKRQWIQLESDYGKMLLDYDTYQLNLNRITRQMLRLSKMKETESLKEATFSTNEKKSKRWYESLISSLFPKHSNSNT